MMIQTAIPTPSSSNKTASEIVSIIARIEWNEMGNEGDPPSLPIEALKDFDWEFQQNPEAQAVFDTLQSQRDDLYFATINRIAEQLEFDPANTTVFYFIENASDDDKKEIIRANEYLVEAMFFRQHFELIDIESRIERVHQGWESAREIDKKLKHPLTEMVREWLIEQTILPCPREYDRTHPVAVLPQKSVALARYPLCETVAEAANLSIEAPSAGQLFMPTLERKMYLPEYLPIQIVQGFDMTGRNGVLPYGMRFYFEVGMSLKPKQRAGWYAKTLLDAARDIGIVDPDSDKESKQYLTTRDKEAIANALNGLEYIRIPYIATPGGLGAWKPFYTQSTPTHASEKDFPIRARVQFPPDDKGGVLVQKEIVRSLYHNIAQFNAYLAACVLFNQYGRTPDNKLIDPTEPDPNTPRLQSGQLVHPTTHQPLFTKRGKPIDDLFHPEVFEDLKPHRIYREAANNYPTLEEEEIMRSVFPHEPWKKDKRNRKRWTDKAWEAWEALAKAGQIRIERKGNGLQILPSDHHIRLHRETLRSSERSQLD